MKFCEKKTEAMLLNIKMDSINNETIPALNYECFFKKMYYYSRAKKSIYLFLIIS